MHKDEETRPGHQMIIVEEIPYQVNKADMVRKTADLVDKRLKASQRFVTKATATACGLSTSSSEMQSPTLSSTSCTSIPNFKAHSQ